MPFTIPMAPLVLVSGRILPDSLRVLLTTNHGDIILFNIPEDRVEHHLPPTNALDYLHHLDISPDGTQFLIVYETKTNPPCHIRDLATFDLLHTFDIPYPLPLKAYFYPNNETLLITAGRAADFYEHGALVRWDVRGSRELERENYTGIFYDLQRVRDGRFLALLPDGKTGNGLNVHEPFSNKPPIALPQGFNTTEWTYLRLSPDGQLLAASDYEGVFVWSVATGSLVSQSGKHSAASVFSPDSTQLLVGYQIYVQSVAEIRDVVTGKLLHELKHSNLIAVDWSADGKYALTVTYGDTAIVWDTTTWQEVTRLTMRSA